MKVRVKTRNLPISPLKLRLVANLIRNLPVTEAKYLLAATNKKAADLIYASLSSAIANAQNNHNLPEHSLIVDEIRVDEGMRLKRYKPRAKGIAGRILRRRSHLTIMLADQKPASNQKSTSSTSKTRAVTAGRNQ